MNGHIVAIGGGTFLTDDPDPRLDAFILGPRPASGAATSAISGPRAATTTAAAAPFYRAMAPTTADPTELTFFERTVEDLEAFVAEQDVFWVGGGSTANLLAIWRLHGLDVAAARAPTTRGAVLCGVSAGMNCWFEASHDRLVRADARARCTTVWASSPGSALPAL